MFLIKNLISAFSMFSALPMPNIQYNEKNTKYMMAFFPFIGLTLGAFIFFWIEICQKLCLGNVFLSLGIVIIPPVISGFIHLDGFMDTLDALASHGTKEKMLSIMKDSHVGAFAVIGLLIYFFLYFAICYELEKSQKTIILLTLIFVLSRTFSGIVSLKFKKSRDNGMLKSISDNSSTEQVILILIFLLFAVEFFAFWVDIKAFVCILISALICSIYCCFKIYNKFKGITGDLSGWYLTLNEIFMLFGLLISQKL